MGMKMKVFLSKLICIVCRMLMFFPQLKSTIFFLFCLLWGKCFGFAASGVYQTCLVLNASADWEIFVCGKFPEPVLVCLFLPADSPCTLTPFGWWLVRTWNTKTQTCRSWPHSHQILLKCTFRCKRAQKRSLATVGKILGREPRENKWLRSQIYGSGNVKGEGKEKSQIGVCFLSLAKINLICVNELESICSFLTR